MTAQTPTVAAVTKRQIGFWALAEVGARNFLQDATALYFDAKPRTRIVQVRVRLEPSDTYSVKVALKNGSQAGMVLYEVSDIYNDQLAEVIRNLSRHV